jgi:hypothetical protein
MSSDRVHDHAPILGGKASPHAKAGEEQRDRETAGDEHARILAHTLDPAAGGAGRALESRGFGLDSDAARTLR